MEKLSSSRSYSVLIKSKHPLSPNAPHSVFIMTYSRNSNINVADQYTSFYSIYGVYRCEFRG